MPLVTTGRNALVQALIGTLNPVFNNANAHLGVGNSTTAHAVTQTDLVGASKTRRPMDATFPSVATNVITAQATYGTGDANHDWNEVGFHNAATAGVMASRVVAALGTKTSASTFVLTYNLTITLQP